jgi:capsular polysaccharide biosynthesis protein
MELRRYWKMIRRRWPLLAIPTIIVLIVGLATYTAPPPLYNAGVRFLVAQAPSPATATTDEERYYNWLTSEYIVNGLADWVRGGTFAGAVSRELAQQGLEVPPGAIQVVPDNARSMLTLSLVHGNPDTLAAIMESAIRVLTEQNAAALPQLGGETAALVQLDLPVVNQLPGSLRSQLDLPLRVLLALGAGFGLALLAEYLDPTIRDREELEAVGLPILGEIPRK